MNQTLNKLQTLARAEQSRCIEGHQHRIDVENLNQLEDKLYQILRTFCSKDATNHQTIFKLCEQWWDSCE